MSGEQACGSTCQQGGRAMVWHDVGMSTTSCGTPVHCSWVNGRLEAVVQAAAMGTQVHLHC
jgi:hypothetical protein